MEVGIVGNGNKGEGIIGVGGEGNKLRGISDDDGETLEETVRMASGKGKLP